MGLSAEERAELKERKRQRNREIWEKKQAENAAKKSVGMVVRNGGSSAMAPISTEKGMKQRMMEFRERLLHAPTGESVIRKVIEIAQNDEHPGQIAALKMCMDRMLPTSMFEEKSDHKPQITISIVGLSEPQQDVIDV